MNRDLQELPRLDTNWSYLYLEHGKIKQDAKTVAFFDKEGRMPIPVETLSFLMLGPGTSITHEAIKRITFSRCLLAWVGEEGVRLYASGQNGTYSARNLLRQVECYSNPELRLKIVRKMYAMRFDEILPHDLSLEQLRGKEGARVRKLYQEMSEKYDVEWEGRSYNQDDWNASNPANKALSAANSCLYGICHAAILWMGCSPGIGFVHTGKQLSFVYDIADLYKSEFTIPIAFEAAEAPASVASRTRAACREAFRKGRILKRIIPDIQELLYGSSHSGESHTEPEGRDVAVNY